MFARKSFWCIDETLKQAGFRTYPYHVYVPSFGEWGFVLASRDDYTPPATLPAGLRFLAAASLPTLFEFPPDMARVPMPANRLNDQVLVRTLEAEWREITPLNADAPRVLRRVGSGARRPVGQGRSADRRRVRQRRRRRSATRLRDARARRRRRRRRFGCPSSSSAAASPGCPPRGVCRRRGFDRFVAARDGRAGGRQLALGRERDDGVSVGRALRAGSGRARDLVRELFEELGRAEAGRHAGTSATCASPRRSGCSSTADGRKASSRRSD